MRRTTSPIALLATTFIVALSCCCGSVMAAEAAEMVDNPQYTSWAKHKPGSKVTMKQDMDMGAMKMSTTMTQTLIEITPEKAVVEYGITMDFGGQKQESKNKQEVAAKVEKGKEFIPPNVKGTVKEAGSEKVEVAGKSYECKVIEFQGEAEQGKSNGKLWHTVEVPGGMAKMEMKMEDPQPGTVKVTVTALDLK